MYEIKQYRKKPIVIRAVQWTGSNHREMHDFLLGNPDEYMKTRGEHFEIDHTKVEGGLVIKTKEGGMAATVGDYIIKGIAGEYYPCKPEIFEATYELVSTTDPHPEHQMD